MTAVRFLLPFLLLVLATPAAAFRGDTVVLQGLDKVTARGWTFEAPVGQMGRFGTLEIVARTCERTPPEEPPESVAFLDISELRSGEAPQADRKSTRLNSSR